MSTNELDELARALFADRPNAADEVYQRLENAEVVNRVKVGSYLCERRGCKLAVVVAVGGRILVRTRDHKKSPGLNAATSVESARRDRTLDGDNHWPGHTFDVGDLAAWGGSALVSMPCRCRQRNIDPGEILSYVDGVEPGRPAKPRRV